MLVDNVIARDGLGVSVDGLLVDGVDDQRTDVLILWQSMEAVGPFTFLISQYSL